MASPSELAMFPLGSVLFPYGDLNLHVFEPRYRMLVRHVLAAGGEFGVVLIERGHEVGGGEERFSVGTRAAVVRADEMSDGRWSLAAAGVDRLRVVRWLSDDPYPRAIVEPLDDDPGPGADEARGRVVAALTDLYALARRVDPTFTEPPPLAEDPARAAYEAARIAPVGELDSQRILEAAGSTERLELVATLVRDHIELLEMGSGPNRD